ncbi:hypothetical protein [Hyphococcus sp.]|uniref:hypothetical protein n=1 Tax=Hyphococcus sp. TaxID=2038636 RepID=UPI003CCBB9DC
MDKFYTKSGLFYVIMSDNQAQKPEDSMKPEPAAAPAASITQAAQPFMQSVATTVTKLLARS